MQHNCSKCIFDPVKQVRIARGPYKGWHNLYISEKIFKLTHNEDVIFPYWEGTTGSWVRVDDGWILQILNEYTLNKKVNFEKPTAKRDWGFTKVFVTAVRMARVYWRKDGSMNASRLFGSTVVLERSHMTENFNPLGRYMNERKRLFILNIVNGMTPAIAYMKAYNVSYGMAKGKAYHLAMRDTQVREELAKHMKSTVIEDMEKKGMTGDYLMDEIKKTIDSNKLNSQVRAAMLLFLTKLSYNIESRQLTRGDPNDLRQHGGLGEILHTPDEVRGQLMERANREEEET
jgi:hypothetical protein